MEPSEQSNTRTAPHFSLYLKYGAILLLLLMSFIVVACSTDTDTTATNLGAPPVTVTVQFDNDLTALPTQAPYLCGAWITNTSPAFIPGSTIPVYAKFVHIVNGNPQGVGGATAQATLYLGNGAVTPLTTTATGPDGLAVFSFQLPNDPNIANRNNLVTVTFSAPSASCTVDQSRAAYFTPVLITPTATPTATPSAGLPPILLTAAARFANGQP